MLARCVVVGLAATAFAAKTIMPTSASAAGAQNWRQPGTWNWPPYAEGGNTPRTTCSYVWGYPYKPRGQGGWVYQCR